MPAKHIIVITLAFVGSTLLGHWFHPLLGVLLFTVSMLILLLLPNTAVSSANNRIKNASVQDDAAEQKNAALQKNVIPLQETSFILNGVIADTQNNLASQIAIQSDAIAVLIHSFDGIKGLLDEQQHAINHLLSATVSLTSPDTANTLKTLSGQLGVALNNAARALQFEDMSRQNLHYCIDRLHELQPIISALTTAEQFPEQLDAQVVRYNNSDLRHKLNPVSASSVASGSVDLF